MAKLEDAKETRESGLKGESSCSKLAEEHEGPNVIKQLEKRVELLEKELHRATVLRYVIIISP